jgi:hypothetical protein
MTARGRGCEKLLFQSHMFATRTRYMEVFPTSVSEPLMKHRKNDNVVKTWVLCGLGDKKGSSPDTGLLATGVEVA